VRILLASAICLGAACSAFAQYHAPAALGQPPPAAPSSQQTGIHASVARIVAPGKGSVSYGSGTLIYADETRGVVITNWHVINEATGQISVHFPDGFYSQGTVQAVDRDWDLAAILIRRPPSATPVPIASQPPFPGEMLTIAGYGSGQYRAASGPCTQYVAPGLEFPFEMVEVAVTARQGDSGGPIFNSRGELAGVLFGEGGGRTAGSYCGRVRWFAASVIPRLPQGGVMFAQNTPMPAPMQTAQMPASPGQSPFRSGPTAQTALAQIPNRPAAVGTQVHTLASTDQAVAAPGNLPVAPPAAGPQPSWESVSPTAPAGGVPVVASTRSASDPQAVQIGWHDIAGDTLAEQAKTVMAAVGVLAILLHALSWLSRGEAAG